MNNFSHIYIEKDAIDYPVTKEILRRFKNSSIIYINHYKDVFNRSRQNFMLQKRSQNLILAVKQSLFLYEGPDICQNFGHKNFYYASTILNCIYDCHYCYLQGLYPSANIVVFVNIDDFFMEVDKFLYKEPIYLCVSYDTDLMALEGIIPYTSKWIRFAKARPKLLMEVRTKSANYKTIGDMEPLENVILAWTLSPKEIIECYEARTPALDVRLKAAKMAMDQGWNVRISIEPIINIKGWREIYRTFIEYIFAYLPSNAIYDINLGPFRMNREYFKTIYKFRADTDVFCLPMECKGDVVCCSNQNNMVQYMYEIISKYYPQDKIYI